MKEGKREGINEGITLFKLNECLARKELICDANIKLMKTIIK